MRRLPRSIFLSPEQIDACIGQRETQASALPPGGTRRELREEIARLHIYAGMKRLVIVRTPDAGRAAVACDGVEGCRRRGAGLRAAHSEQEHVMAHRFSVGQRVRLQQSNRGVAAGSGSFKVIARLPIERGGEIRYRIKSEAEQFARVVDESSLSLAG